MYTKYYAQILYSFSQSFKKIPLFIPPFTKWGTEGISHFSKGGNKEGF
jgi:hypothetical protein